MSFAARMSGHGNIGGVVINVVAIGDSELNPTTATAQLVLGTDGSLSTVGNASSAGTNWYSPTTAGIGTTHWVCLTINTGSAPTSGDSTALWLQLSAGRSWTWTQTITGGQAATCTIEVATDSGGSNIVGTDTFAVDVIVEI